MRSAKGCVILYVFAWIYWSAAQSAIPAPIFPVSAAFTNDKSCNSLGLNKTKMEIEEVLNNQVDPYLTQRYGKPRNCGGPGWTEVLDVDMSNDSMECPTGFTLFSSPVRSCGRPGSVNSVTASFTVKHSYTNICGTIVGIQKGSTDGFGPTFYDSRPMHYVDGIIIWHGSSYSQGHIWTFAAAPRQLATNMRLGCPCSYEQWNFNKPTFVGSNYFCDSGNSGNFSHSTIFLDNPLWDGKGCISNSTCCQFNEPPVFYRELEQSSGDNLKMTILFTTTPDEEDIYLTKMKLYVY